jgi:hypothetical protein
VHDTIELEKRGIPATVIITQAFTNACVFQFRGKGMEGHPYIELPHPISNLKPEEMRALMEKYVTEVVRHLTA